MAFPCCGHGLLVTLLLRCNKVHVGVITCFQPMGIIAFAGMLDMSSMAIATWPSRVFWCTRFSRGMSPDTDCWKRVYKQTDMEQLTLPTHMFVAGADNFMHRKRLPVVDQFDVSAHGQILATSACQRNVTTELASQLPLHP